MNFSNEHIAELLARFTEGQTTEAEESLLARYFSSTADIPAEFQPYKAIFDSFSTDIYDFSSAEMDAFLTPAPKSFNISRWFSVACAAAIFLFIFLYPAVKVSQTDLTTSEIMETVSLLSNVGTDEINTMTVSPAGNGFNVSTTLYSGQSLSYHLQRSADGKSIKLTRL